MSNIEGLNIWTAAFVQCNCCSHEWVAVYIINTQRLECPNCYNLTLFNILKQ
jgi:hypothetical protein